MLLDILSEAGIAVAAIGKVAEVFLDRGITTAVKTSSNAEGMDAILRVLGEQGEGLIWANLIDFDMLYGQRNDVEGYAKAIEAVDDWLPSLLDKLRPGDLLVVTADHGCDPTTESTDHSREYVPLLTLGSTGAHGVDLGIRSSLSDIGQTVAENFGTRIGKGKSFLGAITATAG
jgi:phosphopentomutase